MLRADEPFKEFDVTVKSQDRQGASGERTFRITVFGPGAPDGPVSVSLSNEEIAENRPANTTVGLLRTADSKSTVHTYALVGGPGSDNNGSFKIEGNELKSVAAFDYEAKELYSIRVRSTNGAGAMIERQLIVAIGDDDTEPGEPEPGICRQTSAQLFNTDDAVIELKQIVASGVTTKGCTIQARVRVWVRGSQADNIAFSGRVNAKNQVYGTLPKFVLPIAGLQLEVRQSEFEYYMGRAALRLTFAHFCAPVDWGGICAPSLNILLDGSGLKIGAGIGFTLPDFLIKAGAKKLSGPKLFALKAELIPVPGGYEFKGTTQFGIPKLPHNIGGCSLTASFTIGFDTVTGATVVAFSAAAPQAGAAPNGVALRQVSLALLCSQGIPIDTTGLQLTGVRGTLTLRPGIEQSISLGVTIETLAKVGPLTLLTMNGDATVLWDPVWGFDLVSTLKVLSFIEAARSEMNLREGRFHFEGQIKVAFIEGGGFVMDGWTARGSFHLTGSGRVGMRIQRGSIYQKSSQKCHDVTREVCKVMHYVTFGLGDDLCETVTDRVCNVVSITLPPFDISTPSLNGEFGEFTNGKWGIKVYLDLGTVIGNTARDLLDFFGVPNPIGGYIDNTPRIAFGSVTEYRLVTPPAIPLARQRWQAAQAAQAAGARMTAAPDQPIHFLSEHEMQVVAPITLNATPEVGAAAVISQVRVSAPSTVTFMLASDHVPTMTLFAPDGTQITPANYNQAPISQRHSIEYGQRTIYEPLTLNDAADPNGPRLRFVPAAQHPSLAAVDVLVDDVPVWRTVGAYNPARPDPTYSGEYIAIEPGVHVIRLTAPGQTTTILSTTIDAAVGVGYTLYTAGTAAPRLLVLDNRQSTPPDFGPIYARFVHVGDSNRKINVLVDGAPRFTDLDYLGASPYQLLSAGALTYQLQDATSGALLSPPRILPLDNTVVTFFIYDWNTGEYQADFGSVLDDLYLPRTYTVYNVGGTDLGIGKSMSLAISMILR